MAGRSKKVYPTAEVVGSEAFTGLLRDSKFLVRRKTQMDRQFKTIYINLFTFKSKSNWLVRLRRIGPLGWLNPLKMVIYLNLFFSGANRLNAKQVSFLNRFATRQQALRRIFAEPSEY